MIKPPAKKIIIEALTSHRMHMMYAWMAMEGKIFNQCRHRGKRLWKIWSLDYYNPLRGLETGLSLFYTPKPLFCFSRIYSGVCDLSTFPFFGNFQGMLPFFILNRRTVFFSVSGRIYSSVIGHFRSLGKISYRDLWELIQNQQSNSGILIAPFFNIKQSPYVIYLPGKRKT